jgi:hypothetical protein
MIKSNFPILITGRTGSGKSKFMDYLTTTLDHEKYSFLNLKLRKGISIA